MKLHSGINQYDKTKKKNMIYFIDIISDNFLEE